MSDFFVVYADQKKTKSKILDKPTCKKVKLNVLYIYTGLKKIDAYILRNHECHSTPHISSGIFETGCWYVSKFTNLPSILARIIVNIMCEVASRGPVSLLDTDITKIFNVV